MRFNGSLVTWRVAPPPIGGRRVLGLSIIKFENPKPVSETSTLHECRAVVTLNNTEQYPLSYKFKKDVGGQYLIEVRPVGF
jgi:hypothetical protein